MKIECPNCNAAFEVEAKYVGGHTTCSACGNDFEIVTPGIRPAFADADDQKRIATPAVALNNGATRLVIGRPITKAEDPKKAVRMILEEIRENKK